MLEDSALTADLVRFVHSYTPIGLLVWLLVLLSVIGFLNDHYQASSDNPMGHAPGMWAFSVLGFLALLFALLLRREETGPNAHGLETITAASSKG